MKPQKLKDALKDVLDESELNLVVRAFDIVGDLAIIDIPEELISKEKIIAQILLDLHKNIKVVCKRDGNYSGEFRTIPLKHLAGEDRKETLYKENNCFLYLNPEEVYFSARSSNERKRIANLIQPNETVLVMFAGIAPFALVIAKNSQAKHITAIEKNPVAGDYAKRNIKKNKITNIDFYVGDVNDIIPTLNQKFDRIVMPLPKSAHDFLDLAINNLNSNGFLHFYDFMHEDEFHIAEEKVLNSAKKLNRKVISIKTIPCGHYAPRVNRVCVDAQII
jgi:tRNA (guanine37-N1)-methyltransferase